MMAMTTMTTMTMFADALGGNDRASSKRRIQRSLQFGQFRGDFAHPARR